MKVRTPLTTSFFAQELLNELVVSALTGAELVLAGAEVVLAVAEVVLAVAELVLAGAKLINRRVKLISKLSHHGAQVAISRQALRGRR